MVRGLDVSEICLQISDTVRKFSKIANVEMVQLARPHLRQFRVSLPNSLSSRECVMPFCHGKSQASSGRQRNLEPPGRRDVVDADAANGRMIAAPKIIISFTCGSSRVGTLVPERPVVQAAKG